MNVIKLQFHEVKKWVSQVSCNFSTCREKNPEKNSGFGGIQTHTPRYYLMIELQSHMMEERQISRSFFFPQEASLEYLPTLYLSDNNFNEINSIRFLHREEDWEPSQNWLITAQLW